MDSDAEVSFDTEALRDRLITAADKLLCKEPERWESEYVCKPSNFFHRSMFIFDSISDDLKQAECRMIEKTQLPDGSFDITWQWHNDYKEFEISKNFWKSVIAIKNIRYYLEVGK